MVFDKTVFSGATTITLTVGSPLQVTDSVTVTGPTAATTLDANFVDRHMNIAGTGTLAVGISNLTFINGQKQACSPAMTAAPFSSTTRTSR